MFLFFLPTDVLFLVFLFLTPRSGAGKRDIDIPSCLRDVQNDSHNFIIQEVKVSVQNRSRHEKCHFKLPILLLPKAE